MSFLRYVTKYRFSYVNIAVIAAAVAMTERWGVVAGAVAIVVCSGISVAIEHWADR